MHIDDSDLALLALGEGAENDLAHLQTCSICRSEVDSLAAVTAIMAEGGPTPAHAPAYLWPAIQAAISQQAGPAASRVAEEAAPMPSVAQEAASTSSVAQQTTPISDAGQQVAEPDNIDSRRAHRQAAQSAGRRSPALSLLGAAAVGAGVMWLGTTLVTDEAQPEPAVSSDDQTGESSEPSTSDPEASEPEVVASADLAALEDSVEPATAQIVERDGQRVLRVEAASLPTVEDGYLQVWLLEDDVAGMVTIGALTEGGEEFILPQGLSTDTFTTVDVSVEHYDGNPEHSGESLWRGAITST